MPQLSDYTVPITALQAVNLILEAIGQARVPSLTGPNDDASTAVARLGESSVETQAEGWAYNTDDDITLDPGSDGTIVLPANTLRVRQVWAGLAIPGPIWPGGENPAPGGVLPSGPALVMTSGVPYGSRLVFRQGKLYDRRKHTFVIGCPVRVDLTTCLEFEDLPQAARWYIAVKAARRMVAGSLVSGTAYQFTKADEDQARVRMEQEEDTAESLDDMGMTNPHIMFMRQR